MAYITPQQVEDGDTLSSAYEERLINNLNESSPGLVEAIGDLIYPSEGRLKRLAKPSAEAILRSRGAELDWQNVSSTTDPTAVVNWGTIKNRYLRVQDTIGDALPGFAMLMREWRGGRIAAEAPGGAYRVDFAEDQMQLRGGDLAGIEPLPSLVSQWDTETSPRPQGGGAYGWDRLPYTLGTGGGNAYQGFRSTLSHGMGIYAMRWVQGTYVVILLFNWLGPVTSRQFLIHIIEDWASGHPSNPVTARGWEPQTIADQIAQGVAPGFSNVSTVSTSGLRGRTYIATVAKGSRVFYRDHLDNAPANYLRTMRYLIIGL